MAKSRVTVCLAVREASISSCVSQRASLASKAVQQHKSQKDASFLWPTTQPPNNAYNARNHECRSCYPAIQGYDGSRLALSLSVFLSLSYVALMPGLIASNWPSCLPDANPDRLSQASLGAMLFFVMIACKYGGCVTVSASTMPVQKSAG